jgi:hypothetical protein
MSLLYVGTKSLMEGGRTYTRIKGMITCRDEVPFLLPIIGFDVIFVCVAQMRDAITMITEQMRKL